MKISVIIEWENVLLSEMHRCTTMLKTLQAQILTSKLSTEVIILNNPEQVSNEFVQSVVNQNIHLSTDSPLLIRFEEAVGYHYYELKNYGARLSTGDIIVFIDTDVIPDDNWFYELTKPFLNNPDINVVAGNTYIDPVDAMGKAFALGWYFPMRKASADINKNGKGFFANNVAFRKILFDKYPFPPMPTGMTRGACVMLSEKLINHNIPIWINNAAQVSHPSPTGWKHFAVRALANGRDHLWRRKNKHISSWENYLDLYKYAYGFIKQTLKRSLDKYNYFELTFVDKILVFSIMSLYSTLVIVGGTLALLLPSWTAKWWHI